MVRLFYFIVCFPFFTYAQLTLDPLFSDHMLFQRDKPIVIFGKGTPGERVRIMLGSEWMETSVQDDSTWHGRFPPRIASSIPVSIRILGEKDSFLLHDILVGDVWLCIGQSNMEWPMQKEMFFSLEKGTADQPAIRFMNPTYAGKDVYGLPFSDSIIQNLQHTKFFSGKWQISDSVTFRSMSAVAYYFGKQLYDSTGIPIGLINYSIGGAPLETFIDRNALKTHPRFAAKVKGDWLNNEHLPVWIRERGRQNVGAVEVPSDENGKYHAFKPGVAYESGIKSLHLFPIKGMICYQGESNAQEEERVMEYGELTAFMVNDFRRKWKEPTLPFYFVQLSSIDTVTYKGHLWGPFRNEQRLLLEKLPNSGMAVSSDVGSRLDVHPRNKKDIGKRLARWALKDLYNKQIVPSGPLPLQATYQSGKILIIFKYAEEGLFSSDGGVIRGFSFNGSEEVDVRIRGSAIEIDSPIRPQFVYYGWKSYSNGNLVNAQRLRASTFKIRVLVP